MNDGDPTRPDHHPDNPPPALYTARDVAEFIELAKRGFEGLSLTQRASFNAIAADLIEPFDGRAAELARSTAAFLREADLHQVRLFETISTL